MLDFNAVLDEMDRIQPDWPFDMARTPDLRDAFALQDEHAARLLLRRRAYPMVERIVLAAVMAGTVTR